MQEKTPPRITRRGVGKINQYSRSLFKVWPFYSELVEPAPARRDVVSFVVSALCQLAKSAYVSALYQRLLLKGFNHVFNQHGNRFAATVAGNRNSILTEIG